jgi:hypothetical protein
MSQRTARNACCQNETRENTMASVLQIVKPISIRIRQLYLSTYNLEYVQILYCALIVFETHTYQNTTSS